MAVYVGLGGPRFYMGLDPKSAAGSYGLIQINAVDNPSVPKFVDDLRVASNMGVGEPGSEGFIPPITGARVVPKRLVMGTPVMSPIDIRVLGPRLAGERVLRYYSNRLKDALDDSGMAWDILWLGLLMGLGLREFSVQPRAIAALSRLPMSRW